MKTNKYNYIEETVEDVFETYCKSRWPAHKNLSILHINLGQNKWPHKVISSNMFLYENGCMSNYIELILTKILIIIKTSETNYHIKKNGF